MCQRDQRFVVTFPLGPFPDLVTAAGRIKTENPKDKQQSARFRRLFPEWLARSDLIAVPDYLVVGDSPA